MSCNTGPGTCYIDLTGIGQVGPKGDTGTAGAAGTKILDSDTTIYTTASSGTWESVGSPYSYVLPANTLATNGDEVEMIIFGTGGSATVGKYDQIGFNFNGTRLQNPDAFYKGALTCSYYFPYSATSSAEFRIRVKRVSATSVRIYMYKLANGGNTRTDLYAASTACNNLTNSTNSFALEFQSADTPGTVTIYNITILLNKS
jgi:hypothetical protein